MVLQNPYQGCRSGSNSKQEFGGFRVLGVSLPVILESKDILCNKFTVMS